MLLRLSLSLLISLNLLACGGDPYEPEVLTSRAEVGDAQYMIKHLGEKDIPAESVAFSLNQLVQGSLYSLDLKNSQNEAISGLQLSFRQREQLPVVPLDMDLDAPIPSPEDMYEDMPLGVTFFLSATTATKSLVGMPDQCASETCILTDEMLDSGKSLGDHEASACLPNFEPTDTTVRLIFFIQHSYYPGNDYYLKLSRTSCPGSLPPAK